MQPTRLAVLVSFSLCAACAGTASAVAPNPAPKATAGETLPQSRTPLPPREVLATRGTDPVDGATASDLAFIANAEDSIRLHQAFIERAAAQPRYAPALERSRERIADLQAEIAFVEEGMRSRKQAGMRP